MFNIEMSNVHCMLCNAQFTECDLIVMEEDELPICDLCIEGLCRFHVKYDGSRDLLEFLIDEIKGSKCAGCLKPELELTGIRYGNTVWGHGKCSECKQGWSLNIHIEFV